MKNRFEKTYGKTMQGIFFAVNPFKKKILKTHCTIHRYINMRAIELLNKEGYKEEYVFFKQHIQDLNEGVTWADQDFKSSNHFYHFSKGKGLYGFSDALSECKKYYNKAIAYYKIGELEKSIFYFGAACHLVQDATVPQHVNNKLLKSHRAFELWIISKFMSDYSFEASENILRYKSIEAYIMNNALMANNTFLKYIDIEDRNERYGKISSNIIKEAQRTTAGFMLDFFNNIIKATSTDIINSSM